MPTKFKSSAERGRTTRGQIVIYGMMILLSAAVPVPYVHGWWTAHHQALAVEATPTPANQVQRPTATIAPTPTQDAQLAQAQPTPTEDQRREWKHVPASQIDPGPMPAATPPPATEPARSTPDPVEARHTQWQTLHDAYVVQVRARVQSAKTDAEKSQIQRDIAAWQRANPEPSKPTPTPTPNVNGERQIPFIR